MRINHADWNVLSTAPFYSYIANIANELLAPETTTGQTQRIMKEICSLDEMPMRFRLYEDELWNSRGLRFFPVDNYLPKESTNTVDIVRIIYGGRDIRRQLSKTVEY